jgi:hypothetical protein
MSLVERDGQVRSFHIEDATAKTLAETARKVADRKSYLMTDENGVNDPARSKKLLKGIVGKRLTYRRPGKAAHA